jgi:hypothetical protein
MVRTAAANWCAGLLGLALAGFAAAADPPTAQDLPPPRPSATAAPEPPAGPNPPVLRRPLESPPPTAEPTPAATPPPDGLLRTPTEPPLGFAGPSGILPREEQESSHFVPVEDRWRLGFPDWDRYGKGHPPLDDYPYDEGSPFNPYKQNVLKGDYPIIGQHTFLDITASTDALVELRELPTPAHSFEATRRTFQEEFFGRPGQLFYSQNFVLSFDLFHGDAGFKPVDWRVKVTPIFNVNYIDVDELAIVNPDVRKGTTRGRTWFTLQEYFAETKLADTSPYFDFVSVRVGSQPFVSDFRGFIFSDTNRAVRLFGTALSNQDQFNLIYFRQAEKDTDSELNTFDDRGQDILIANYFHQDFLFPGYTAEWSVHYNHDRGGFHFDKDNFLVRPDPVGVFKPHELNVAYLGFAGDGHIGPINITNAFYWALGYDTQNPLANSSQFIDAQMAAVELSKDVDWARFRVSFFWASGDDNINNHHATGFDAIFDDPNFAGGQFSFWQRQAIRLFGVNLTNRGSLLPDLKSSKIEGQSNFVNPGLYLANAGIDFELTPKLRMINNVNFLWFDETNVLEQFVFDGRIHKTIGLDPSMGFEYRPLLSNNVIIRLGLSALIPGEGFRDLYDRFNKDVDPLFAAFLDVNLNF